ncbi:hypothetical protein KA005_21980 [bacterium]|nr:hypothetical protein [bacterium]
MHNLTKLRTTIQLNVSQEDGDPSIFVWTILPEYVTDLSQSESGGTDVTVLLPNGEKATLTVTQDLDLIKKAIEICKQKDGL